MMTMMFKTRTIIDECLNCGATELVETHRGLTLVEVHCPECDAVDSLPVDDED